MGTTGSLERVSGFFMIVAVCNERAVWLYETILVYTRSMAKHLVDLDEEALGAARAELGTATIKETVNEALRRATLSRDRRVAAAFDVLANAHLDDRAEAWR
jgi:Arc/MetJ family transcription regulator